MDFRLKNSQPELEAGFFELLSERGYACRGGISVTLELADKERITVSYEGTEACITAPEKAFLYRGLMTLVRNLEQNPDARTLEWTEEIHFDKNGVMLDCSRNCVMSLPAAKAWIRMQASAGMNLLMLYTEDTYEVPGYPYFGALRGRYTKEELQELDCYGQMFGIELIPCIQTLGHLQQPLRWDAMKNLRDTSDILMVGKEETYQFIRACLKQVSECFSTRKVHLGMDEAWTLGLGKYLIQNGYRDKDQIMKEHLSRIMELCEEFDLEPMMWSDMYFRVHSATEDYYDVPFDTDMRTKELPPEKMGMIYWDYYHLEEEYYRAYIRLHRQITDRVIFAGGGWSWNGTVPNLKTGYAVTHAGLGACRKEGVREVFITLWGDDGMETPEYSALGPVLLCAEYGFGKIPDENRVRELFEFLTGCSYDEYRVLGDFDIWTETVSQEEISANPSKNFLYQDVLLGIYDGQMENVPVGMYYAELRQKMKAAGTVKQCGKMQQSTYAEKDSHKGQQYLPEYSFWGKEMRQILDYYQVYAETLSIKTDLGIRLRTAYLNSDREELRRIREKDLPEAIRLAKQCRKLRKNIWMKEGRIFGWEVLDIRFHALTGRMESAAQRLDEYLTGQTEALPELEGERLPVLPALTGEKRHCGEYNSWLNTVSPSPLAWGWLPQ